MEMTIEELYKKLAFIAFENAYRYTSITEGTYEDRLYDNWQMLGSVVHSFFPDEYNEGEFLFYVREAELNGVVVQICRTNPGEKASSFIRHPDNPAKHVDLLGKTECYLKNKLQS